MKSQILEAKKAKYIRCIILVCLAAILIMTTACGTNPEQQGESQESTQIASQLRDVGIAQDVIEILYSLEAYEEINAYLTIRRIMDSMNLSNRNSRERDLNEIIRLARDNNFPDEVIERFEENLNISGDRTLTEPHIAGMIEQRNNLDMDGDLFRRIFLPLHVQQSRIASPLAVDLDTLVETARLDGLIYEEILTISPEILIIRSASPIDADSLPLFTSEDLVIRKDFHRNIDSISLPRPAHGGMPFEEWMEVLENYNRLTQEQQDDFNLEFFVSHVNSLDIRNNRYLQAVFTHAELGKLEIFTQALSKEYMSNLDSLNVVLILGDREIIIFGFYGPHTPSITVRTSDRVLEHERRRLSNPYSEYEPHISGFNRVDIEDYISSDQVQNINEDGSPPSAHSDIEELTPRIQHAGYWEEGHPRPTPTDLINAVKQEATHSILQEVSLEIMPSDLDCVPRIDITLRVHEDIAATWYFRAHPDHARQGLTYIMHLVGRILTEEGFNTNHLWINGSFIEGEDYVGFAFYEIGTDVSWNEA